MDVTAATIPGQSVGNTQDRTMINSDFQTFLAMLTAQMDNQDPLDPMDSSDFATQLATFSGVEQQVRTNDLLTGLQQTMARGSMSQMADWIGMDARAEMPMAFQGAPLTLFAPTNLLADRMELVVTDANGAELQRVHVPSSETPFEWAGVTTDGSPLPEAIYGFHVEYFRDDEAFDMQQAQGYAQIEEAQILNGEVWLSLPGGVQIRSGLVNAVRDSS